MWILSKSGKHPLEKHLQPLKQEPGSIGIPSMQIEDDAPIVSSGDDHVINATSSGNNDVTLNQRNTSFFL